MQDKGTNCTFSEPAHSSGRASLPALTGLRFLAAFLVLLAHGVHSIVGARDVTTSWADFGFDIVWLGMTLFFVLSGFVIHYNYSQMFRERPFLEALREFASARIARIYPLFLFFFLVAMALNPLSRFDHSWSYTFIPHLTLTQSWYYSLVDLQSRDLIQTFYPHSWSISTEFFFYAMYPLLFFGLVRLRKPQVVMAAIAFVCLFAWTTLWASFCWWTTWKCYVPALVPGNLDSYNGFLKWFAYYAPPTRILEFFLGCLTAEFFLIVRNREPRKFDIWCGKLALGVAILLLVALHIVLHKKGDNASMHSPLSFMRQNFLYAASGRGGFVLLRPV